MTVLHSICGTECAIGDCVEFTTGDKCVCIGFNGDDGSDAGLDESDAGADGSDVGVDGSDAGVDGSVAGADGSDGVVAGDTGGLKAGGFCCDGSAVGLVGVVDCAAPF